MTLPLFLALGTSSLAALLFYLDRHYDRAALRYWSSALFAAAPTTALAASGGAVAEGVVAIGAGAMLAWLVAGALAETSLRLVPPARVTLAVILTAASMGGSFSILISSGSPVMRILWLSVSGTVAAAALGFSAYRVLTSTPAAPFGRRVVAASLALLAVEWLAWRGPGSPFRAAATAQLWMLLDVALLVMLVLGAAVGLLEEEWTARGDVPALDTLTGLPRRRHFRRRLAAAISVAASRRQRFAVMFLDLDRFKQINDSLGHAAGDAVLRAVAGRVRSVVGPDSEVCRLGGDEFTILVPRISDGDEASHLAARIRDAIVQPFAHEGKSIPMSTSIGIALYPDHGSGDDLLLERADEALYDAKHAGRNAFALFGAATRHAASPAATTDIAPAVASSVAVPGQRR